MQFCFDLHAMNVLQRGVRISPVTSVTTHTPDWCTCTRNTFLNDIVRILYFCIYFCTYAKCLLSSKRLLHTHTVTHTRTKTLSSILHYIHLAYMQRIFSIGVEKELDVSPPLGLASSSPSGHWWYCNNNKNPL